MKRTVKLLFISVLVIAAWFMMAGTAYGAVKLKSNKPLIDLGAEVGDSKPGHGGNSDTGLTGEIEEDTEGEAEVVIRVSIMGTTIMVNGNTVTETSLKSAIGNIYEVGMEVYLIDNYADAKTYKAVLNILDDMKLSPIKQQVD